MTEKGKARLSLSSRFYFDVILPYVKEHGKLTAQEYDTLLIDFRNQNPGLGDDFEKGHVWGAAYSHNLYIQRIRPLEAGYPQTDEELAAQVLQILTELD